MHAIKSIMCTAFIISWLLYTDTKELGFGPIIRSSNYRRNYSLTTNSFGGARRYVRVVNSIIIIIPFTFKYKLLIEL